MLVIGIMHDYLSTYRNSIQINSLIPVSNFKSKPISLNNRIFKNPLHSSHWARIKVKSPLDMVCFSIWRFESSWYLVLGICDLSKIHQGRTPEAPRDAPSLSLCTFHRLSETPSCPPFYNEKFHFLVLEFFKFQYNKNKGVGTSVPCCRGTTKPCRNSASVVFLFKQSMIFDNLFGN